MFKLLLVLAIIIFFIFAFSHLMRQLLNIGNKWDDYPNSSHFVNNAHKIIHWIIIIFCFVAIIFDSDINHLTGFDFVWLQEPQYLVLIFIVLTESVSAYMEWKHIKNRNVYIYTLSLLIFNTTLLLIIIYTDFFGLFDSIASG